MSATKTKVKEYIVKQVMSYEDAKATVGQFYDKFSRVIDHDANVYRLDDKGNKIPLFFFRKKILPDPYMQIALDSLKSEAQKSMSHTRMIAGGMDSHVKSMIIGYFDKPILQEKRRILREGLVPCRTTAFTKKHSDKWEKLIPVINCVNDLYKKFLPKHHKEQYDIASLTPEFQIEDTAFSTITVNYNWRTACHVDSGDYHNGYSVILAATEGDFTGGYLGYPQFDIAVNICNGDMLLKDPHQFHANTPIIPNKKNAPYTRLSMVFYYREDMQKCIQKQLNPTTRCKSKIHKTEYNISIRTNTSDKDTFDTVFNTKLPKIQFNTGELWCDFNSKIGCHTLLLLSHGCSVIAFVEAMDNEEYNILNNNITDNFDEKYWIINKFKSNELIKKIKTHNPDGINIAFDMLDDNICTLVSKIIINDVPNDIDIKHLTTWLKKYYKHLDIVNDDIYCCE